MRALRLLILPALLLSAAPGAPAVESDASDLALCRLYGPAEGGGGWFGATPALDLTGVWFGVQDHQLLVRLDLADLDGGYPQPALPLDPHANYGVSWLFGSGSFLLRANVGESGWSFSGRYTEGIVQTYAIPIEATADGVSDTIAFSLSLDEMETSHYDRTLEHIRVDTADVLFRSSDYAPYGDEDATKSWFSLDTGCP